METVIDYLEPEEHVVLIPEKHVFMKVLAYIFMLPLVLIACFNILDFFIVNGYPDLFFETDRLPYETACSLLMIMLFSIVLINYYGSKMIFTDKKVIIKKSYSRRLILIPYSDLERLHWTRTNAHLYEAYFIRLYLKDGSLIRSTRDYSIKGVIAIRKLFSENAVDLSKSKAKNSLNPVEVTSYRTIRLNQLKDFIPALTITVLPVLALILVIFLQTGMNSKIGAQYDITETGYVVKEENIDYYVENHLISIKSLEDDSQFMISVGPELYEKAEDGMPITMYAKKGCLGVLYNTRFELADNKRDAEP